MFCLSVYRFLARIQSPSCTTYGKCLLESVMAVLTLKFGYRGMATAQQGLEDQGLDISLTVSVTVKDLSRKVNSQSKVIRC